MAGKDLQAANTYFHQASRTALSLLMGGSSPESDTTIPGMIDVEPERPDVRALQRGSEGLGDSLRDLQNMLQQAQEMYEDCLQRANPEPA